MMGPARAARHRPYNACPSSIQGQHPLRRLACPWCRVGGDSQSRPSRPAHGYPREQALLGPRHQASPPRQTRTAEGCAGRRSAQGRGRVVESARSTPAARPLPFPQEPTPGGRSEREPASEAGGRVGVGPDCYDDPHRRSHGGAHSSSRLAPTTPTHSSSDEPHRWCPRVPARRPHPGRWSHQAASSSWVGSSGAGRRGAGRSGACPAPPALPRNPGCRQRSTSARWRPSRSAPPCPGAGCRSG